MEKLTRFFTNNPILVQVCVGVLLVCGVFAVSRMNRDAFPEITIGTVVITTVYPGASAVDVELNVTIPIEEALEEASGIEEVVSLSAEGLSKVTVTVDSDADEAYFEEIHESIDQAIAQVNNLPDGIDGHPVAEKVTSYDVPFIEIVLVDQINSNHAEYPHKHIIENVQDAAARKKGCRL